MSETTGGAAQTGGDSLNAALREVKEETGLTALPENGRILFSYRKENFFNDVWLFEQDFDVKDVVLLEGETCDAKYASREDILEMYRDGVFVPYSYFQRLLDDGLI